MLFYFIPVHSKPLHCIFFSKHNIFHLCLSVTKFFSFFYLLEKQSSLFFLFFFSYIFWYESHIDWILTLKENIPDASSQVYLSVAHLFYLRNKCLGGEKMHQNNFLNCDTAVICTGQWSIPKCVVWICSFPFSLGTLNSLYFEAIAVYSSYLNAYMCECTDKYFFFIVSVVKFFKRMFPLHF